jgi:regulator of replication initiation timing
MEPIVNYLEDTEKKLVKEMSELFCKMREQRDTMSLQGIETMYTYKPIEGVLYEPCVRIPLTVGPLKGDYYWNDFTLPKDEYVIFIKETVNQHQFSDRIPTYTCIALTNYGRYFTTKRIMENKNSHPRYPGSYNSRNDNIPIIKLDPLPHKIPANFFKIFLLGFNIGTIPIDSLHATDGSRYRALQILSDTTTSLQELNKEFYLFAGKWQPHMTQHATLDVDTMRQTILENTNSIQDLSEKNKELEEQNKKLQAELQELKEQKASLEKEKAKLLPLEKYKDAVIDFMENHYIGNEPWDHDDTSDKDIIEYFSNWHNDKVFMDQYEYDDFMNQQEELNEYRIYKKVKGRK